MGKPWSSEIAEMNEQMDDERYTLSKSFARLFYSVEKELDVCCEV